VALVVGIDGNANVQPLTRARNDANAIARQLTGTGFDVILRTDPDRRGISMALAELEEKLRGAEVGMFFFVGHGVGIRGTNVLLPSDIPATLSESILLREGFLLTDVAQAMTDSGVRYSALIIDACRDNPLPRQAGCSVGRTRGLGRAAAPQGTCVVYSAGIGEAPLDRLSDTDPVANSVFTRYLLPALAQLGLSLDAAVKQVRDQVRTDAGSVRHQQNPAIYDQATGELFLIPQAPQPPPPPQVVHPAPPPTSAPPGDGTAAAELVFWQSVPATGRPAELEAYLERWPTGIFAPIARARLAGLASRVPSRSVPHSATLGRDGIIQLQRRLATLGLDPGAADGAPGQRTLATIRAAQYALGQTPDGEPARRRMASPRRRCSRGLGSSRCRKQPTSRAAWPHRRRRPWRSATRRRRSGCWRRRCGWLPRWRPMADAGRCSPAAGRERAGAACLGLRARSWCCRGRCPYRRSTGAKCHAGDHREPRGPSRVRTLRGELRRHTDAGRSHRIQLPQ
jgi:hypothetical protein